jgi:hypothetical protein
MLTISANSASTVQTSKCHAEIGKHEAFQGCMVYLLIGGVKIVHTRAVASRETWRKEHPASSCPEHRCSNTIRFQPEAWHEVPSVKQFERLCTRSITVHSEARRHDPNYCIFFLAVSDGFWRRNIRELCMSVQRATSTTST